MRQQIVIQSRSKTDQHVFFPYTTAKEKHEKYSKTYFNMIVPKPQGFFFPVIYHTDTESSFIKPHKKLLSDRAWSVKKFTAHIWLDFSCGAQRVIPKGQDSTIFLCRVAYRGA